MLGVQAGRQADWQTGGRNVLSTSYVYIAPSCNLGKWWPPFSTCAVFGLVWFTQGRSFFHEPSVLLNWEAWRDPPTSMVNSEGNTARTRSRVVLCRRQEAGSTSHFPAVVDRGGSGTICATVRAVFLHGHGDISMGGRARIY
jgi:hypothetical protein